jgi:hypothetical protein
MLGVAAQQRSRFLSKKGQFCVVRSTLIHPLDRTFVALTGLILITSLPVGHGQEEPVGAIAASAQFD